MATNVTAGTVWELRPDGASSNGGGFDAGLGGTDYSQQAAPVLTVTDLVNSAASTTYTSAIGGFTAAMVGNVLNFSTGGVNNVLTIMTVVNSNTITLKLGYGTFSGVTAHVGGAMTIGANGFDPIGLAGANLDGIKIWVRDTKSDGTAGGYANAAATNFSFAGNQTQPFTIEGYSTTRGDGGRFGLTMTSNYLTISANYGILKNARLIGVSGWECGISVTGNGNVVDNVLIEPNANSTAADYLDVSGSDNTLRRVYIKSSTKDIYSASFGGARNTVEHCDFGSVAGSVNGHAIALNGFAEFYHCIFRDCSGHGVFANNAGCAGRFHNCNFWNNTGDNIHLSNAAQGLMNFTFEDCIFGKAGAYDVSYTPADLSADLRALEWAKVDLRGNWFFTTGTGRYHFLPVAPDDTALSGDPFVAASTGNFAVNGATAAGAAILAKPRAVVLPDGSISSIVAGAISPVTTVPAATPFNQAAPVIDEIQFPTAISRGMVGGPTYSTVVVAPGGGSEQRVGLWTRPRYRYEINNSPKQPSEMQAIINFFHAREGRLRGFRFKDWSDFAATNEPLTPTGALTVQLIKTYSSGPSGVVRNIYKPVASPAVTLQRNGSPYLTFALDTTTGLVTLTADSTATITAITQAANALVTTSAAHGLTVGQTIYFSGVVGMTAINGLTGVIQTTPSGTTFTVNIATTTFSAYSSGGVASKFVQPGESLTWTGNFDVPVRFDVDELKVSFDDPTSWSLDNVPIVEVRTTT